MSFENTFNQEIAKKMAKLDGDQDIAMLMEKEFVDMKKRMFEMNEARLEMSKGYSIVLQGLKKAFPELDLTDPNIVDSPNRMARALIEVCSGLGMTEKEVFSTTFPAEKYNQVIILKDIDFTSLCSHHFFPFTGKAHVGYLPDINSKNDSRVVGLSKLARVVDIYAQRPQLQERLSFNIMNAIKENLRPAGVMVVIEGQHGCLNCRGAKKANASMFTSAISGSFKEDAKLRKEFLSLIGKHNH
jgi:GTP cyclohydrolase IA